MPLPLRHAANKGKQAAEDDITSEQKDEETHDERVSKVEKRADESFDLQLRGIEVDAVHKEVDGREAARHEWSPPPVVVLTPQHANIVLTTLPWSFATLPLAVYVSHAEASLLQCHAAPGFSCITSSHSFNNSVSVFRQTATLPLAVYVSHAGASLLQGPAALAMLATPGFFLRHFPASTAARH